MHRVASLLLLPLLLLFSCIGSGARETVTLPAMQQAWGGIRAQAVRTIEANTTTAPQRMLLIAAADEAMRTGQAVKILAVDWVTIYSAAETDIQRRVDAAEIGNGLAESLREELRLFTESRATYTRSSQ